MHGVFKQAISRIGIKFTDQVALAVSGGADSLALALFAISYLKPSNITSITVDHKIRECSTKEAEYVLNLLKPFNLKESKILPIQWPQGIIPHFNKIELTCREERYNILCNYCIDNGIRYLLTAHHLDDQCETFVHRLQMGSSIDGLKAMGQVIKFDRFPSISICRPLLEMRKENLQSICKSYKLQWVNDITNSSTLQTRNCIRFVLAKNIYLQFQVTELIRFCTFFFTYVSKQINYFIKYNVSTNVKEGYCFFSWKKFKQIPRSVAIRIMVNLTNYVSGYNANNYYFSKNFLVAYNRLMYIMKTDIRNVSLFPNTVVIVADITKDRVFIGKTTSYLKIGINMNEEVVYDLRYAIKMNKLQNCTNVHLLESKSFYIRAFKSSDYKVIHHTIRKIKSSKLPLVYFRESLPVVVDELDKIIFMPHFKYLDMSYPLNFHCQFSPKMKIINCHSMCYDNK